MSISIMSQFYAGEIGVAEVIEAISPPTPPGYVRLDGLDYEEALEFAEDLIRQGERGKQLLDALQKMKKQAASP